jgi:hypothetical protein
MSVCRARMRILITISLLAASLGTVRVEAQSATPWLGTWHLNVEKSTWVPGPAPYKRGTWAIRPAEGDRVLMVYNLVGVRGGVTHMEWIGRFDGADYPMQGPDAPVTYAYTPIDDRTLSLVVKVDGNIAATAKVTLLPDGRTIATETTSNNARLGRVTTTSVYEKR